ncbi:hypothetical protein BJV85_001516 [Clostridium acetobutylicum]|nr:MULTISPECIES: hypothetical protein [Clostridium]ADZ21420.1 Conserved hypothetical protein [Clostridium acetobutylicum EA 2018]NOW13106.1 hypothetical protein [Clostridium acetobutylicum]NRY55483.1 hypothetical protein [Clostridium acetobutylicum]NSA92670.1 hypothetical protein [Clostridium acetobutylicum]NYC93688.1 hypothetical protein [Clostridium acetobutylicum]
MGMKARIVYLIPFSPYDGDNHVVCEVFISEKRKWIMLDPTYSGYIMDNNYNIYSILELRYALASRTSIKFSEKFNYNGDYEIDFKEMGTYYAKNLFYLSCREIQTFNSEQLNDNRIRV